MDQLSSGGNSIRFLSFSDDQDAEKTAKLKEAALKIEEAIAKEKALSELIDYKPDKEDDAIDPENDNRPLYQRLLEQKNKRQDELEESQKLSNLVTKLDEEDASYLNTIARNKQEEELRKRLEIHDVLEGKKRWREKISSDEEKKLKESLTSSIFKEKPSSSPLKHRLSSLIKVRPKKRRKVDIDGNDQEPGCS